MGKRKAKPLLAVQGIVHLTESFVQPSQESGLLNTVGGDTECPGLILAPNYGYAISASSLAKKAEEEAAEAQKASNEAKDNSDNAEKSDTENIENETPATTDTEAEESPPPSDLSVAELVRHIGGAKDKPLRRGDIVEDRPDSELPQKPIEEDDPETAKFYESLGIARPTASKDAPVVEKVVDESTENPMAADSTTSDEALASVPESIAEYYRNYPTQYVYSVPSDPYGTQRLEFNLPTAPYEEDPSDSSYTIVEMARRAQRAKREYEAKKAALEKSKSKTSVEEDEQPYDPLPMEIVPSTLVGPEVRPEESNLNTYWEYVQVNPYDFNRWSFLISYAENTNLLNEVRKVYSAFLPLYPYCFGYWKRYSDIEKAHNYFQRALKILQSGLEFIPLCVDLWMSYLTLFAEIHAHNKDFENLLREQYELAINNCGMEFRSDAVWDSFIQWETNLQKHKHAFVLYKRLLQVPTRLYNRHWDNCKILIRDHHPRDFLSHDDYENVRKRGCKVLGFRYKAEPEIEPGEIRKTKKPEDKLMAYVKEKVIEKLTKVQTHTALETDKRWDFEDKIKRPYFHVKPLDKSQLWNWEDYLNFEIREGNHDRTVLLFERCLVACANYERFWCKYARYIEKYHRKNPSLDSSTHLQHSRVNVEIVSKKEAAEEEEIIMAVQAVVSSLVTRVVDEELKEAAVLEEIMESMLAKLDGSFVEAVDHTTVTSLWDVAVGDPENLCGNSENNFAELPTDSNNESGFAALLRTPTFPPALHRWHEVLRDIYKRAALIHCPRKPTIRLQWAAFEEEIGNVKESRELISYVLEWYPNCVEAKLQLLDLERRTSKHDEVVQKYEDFIKNCKSKEVISLMSMKYARFLFKEMGFADKALKVLRTALKKDTANHNLYAQVYEICYHRFPADRKGAFAALELASRAEKLTPEQKLIFARKRVHFFQEHSDLVRYRNALDDLYELEAVVRQKEQENKKWLEFQAQLAAQKAEEVSRSLQPFPVPTSPQKGVQKPVSIAFDHLDAEGNTIQDYEAPIGSTDVGPSLPYAAVPPVQEFLDPNYGYGGKHPDAKLAEHLGHKQYESIEAKGYPETIKDTEADLELLRERKRKNPLYIVPPKGSFYINSSDPDVPGMAKKIRLEAPVLLSELITPNSAPCVNVPDWFVKEGGELCLSETVHGFSILRYWPHFLSEDGNLKMFNSLRKSVKWHQKQILTSYGSWRHIPRLVSWLGPCEYSHTGMVMNKCEDWTPEILDLLHRLVQLVNYEFNSCSLNLYRTGHDSNAWHADIHPALGSNPPIASVSLGALRTFEMKRKGANSTNFIRFPLFPGSLLVMEGATQADWLHQVPKEPATKAERLNLTFRIMHALADEDPDEPPPPPPKEAEKEKETEKATEKEAPIEKETTKESVTISETVKEKVTAAVEERCGTKIRTKIKKLI